jgi:diguanylate cyclase (GGDEF)-like protein
MRATAKRVILTSWEHSIELLFRALKLDSIRNKILVFALLATLIPALSTAVLSYVQNKRALTEKLNEELLGVTSQAAREVELWIKERFFDVRVFAGSFEVTENLARVTGRTGRSTGDRQAIARINDYLRSVQDPFPDYEEFTVLDREGQFVASGSGDVTPMALSGDWLANVERRQQLIGEPFWDDSLGKAVVMTAIPIYDLPTSAFLGVWTAKVSLDSVHAFATRFAPGESGQIFVVTNSGDFITSSRANSAEVMATAFEEGILDVLSTAEDATASYRDRSGTPVVATLEPVPRADWSVVAELPRAEAYAQVTRLRNFAVLLVLGLFVVVGLIAYVLGLLIVRPLDRLTKGASEVAGGDLSVDLPVLGGGEVGYLTEVFNNMVARLRAGREELDDANETLRDQNEELERLSVTDGLTGLYNRRHLMTSLDAEERRAKRHSRPFAMLMIDVDRFKKFNDKFGHLAGDDVLAGVASVILECTRKVDCASRYGGEEFAVMLSESDLEGAVEVAERIRSTLAERAYEGTTVTVSIGAAEFPVDGETPEEVIANADAALYRAKRQGRNRVVGATRKKAKKTPTKKA